MPTYTVHAPPLRKSETSSAPERFRFVRDGFHFWAFVLPPVWLLVHRLWLSLVAYLVLYGLLIAAMLFAGVSPNMQLLAGIVIGLLMGFEAASIERWTLSRRGWEQVGFVVAEDAEMAEKRFFAEWAKRPTPSADVPPPPPSPATTTPVRRGPPTGNDVIGLFPEPGGPR